MIRILLIEDDRWLAESYQRILTDVYEVTIASGGQEALDHIDTHTVDLIVADIMLDGGVVIDVLHDLKSYIDTRDIPVILLSSLSGQVALSDVESYGVVALLDKAVATPRTILQTIQKVATEKVVSRG